MRETTFIDFAEIAFLQYRMDVMKEESSIYGRLRGGAEFDFRGPVAVQIFEEYGKFSKSESVKEFRGLHGGK